MRASLALVATIVLAGCVTPPSDPVDDDFGLPPEPEPRSYHWKPGHVLSLEGPASAAPQKVYAYPTANAYTNEDVEVFASDPVPQGFIVEEATIRLSYGVDRPTGYPGTATVRHFVLWLGSGGVYNAYEEVTGPAVLSPLVAYNQVVTFDLPPGGWHVPAGEPLQVLIAPLVVEPGSGASNLHYLVDSEAADSRIDLLLQPWTGGIPAGGDVQSESVQVQGNTGLFTGAVPASDLNTVRRPVEVALGDAYLEVDVRFRSTQGGKSDLDLDLLDATDQVVAASTTPYQSEQIRLFGSNLAELGPGAYTVVVTAYSGVDTEFDLVVTHAPVSTT